MCTKQISLNTLGKIQDKSVKGGEHPERTSPRSLPTPFASANPFFSPWDRTAFCLLDSLCSRLPVRSQHGCGANPPPLHSTEGTEQGFGQGNGPGRAGVGRGTSVDWARTAAWRAAGAGWGFGSRGTLFPCSTTLPSRFCACEGVVAGDTLRSGEPPLM